MEEHEYGYGYGDEAPGSAWGDSEADRLYDAAEREMNAIRAGAESETAALEQERDALREALRRALLFIEADEVNTAEVEERLVATAEYPYSTADWWIGYGEQRIQRDEVKALIHAALGQEAQS